MQKIILKIDGMMCGMCESHINDAIRNAFAVKKVKSSRAKGVTEILTETDIPEGALRSVIGKTGYELKSVEKTQYKSGGCFFEKNKNRS